MKPSIFIRYKQDPSSFLQETEPRQGTGPHIRSRRARVRKKATKTKEL